MSERENKAEDDLLQSVQDLLNSLYEGGHGEGMSYDISSADKVRTALRVYKEVHNV